MVIGMNPLHRGNGTQLFGGPGAGYLTLDSDRWIRYQLSVCSMCKSYLTRFGASVAEEKKSVHRRDSS